LKEKIAASITWSAQNFVANYLGGNHTVGNSIATISHNNRLHTSLRQVIAGQCARDAGTDHGNFAIHIAGEHG
jgi:hypothetical protein